MTYSKATMEALLWVVVAFNQLFLLMIGAMQFSQYNVSDFVFTRRLADLSKSEADTQKKVYKKLPEILALQRIELVIAATTLCALLTYLTSLPLGIIYSLISFAVLRVLTRLSFIQDKASQLFFGSTDLIFNVIAVLYPIFKLLGMNTHSPFQHIESHDEFKDMLRRLPSTVVSSNQRQKLETVLASEEKTVKYCMTPKKQVTAVEPHATLGPIVLSDLQKTGHGYFPVVTKKGDVEGILRLSDVSDIASAKKRSSVSEFLSPHIAWVNQSASLEKALQLFLSEKQYIVFTYDETNEWTGIITAADLIKNTIGLHPDA